MPDQSTTMSEPMDRKTKESALKQWLFKIIDRVTVGVLLSYPFLVYFVIREYGVRAAAVGFLVLLLPRLFRLNLHKKKGISVVLIQVGGIGLLALLSLLFNDQRFILQLPVIISFFLLVSFTLTLKKPPSMIERFARLLDPDLPDEEVLYCERVTQVWIVFFAFNGIVAEVFVLREDVAGWALFTGLIAYIIMGIIFTVEYIVRKLKFRRFDDHLLDRLLKRLLVGFFVPGPLNKH